MKICVVTLLKNPFMDIIKKNNRKECLSDFIAEKEASVAMVVDQEASIVKLKKVVEILEMFVTQKRQ